jgi:RHS repeat-associated protein
LNKKVTQATNITNTDYLAGFQYKNSVLQFFPHAEGYVNATQNGTSYTFNYVYNYTDHLGNIRLSYSQDPSTSVLKIIEENHYYPFGLKHTGYNSDQMMYVKEASVLKIKPKPPLFKTVYDKKFNGKSWETDLSLNIYDFHARGYMPDIVRTFQQDPLAEKFSNMSPYSFLNNNPLRFTDPTGMASDDIIIIGSKNNQLKYENGNLYNLDGTSYTGKIDKFTQKTVDALGEISKSTEGASMIKELQSSSNTFTIENGKYNNFTPSKSTSAMSNIPELQAAEPSLKPSNGSGGRIVFNPNSNSSGLNTSGNTNRPEYIGLAHEMFHGRDANNGVMYPSSDWKSFKAEHNGLYKSEWRAVFYENTVRSQLKIPLRTHYGLSIDSQGNQSGMGPRLLDSNNNPINYTIK